MLRFVVCIGLALCVGVVPVAGQERVREVVSRIPARLPLKVAFKHQERVADPNNEQWLSDLEVVVTNTGSKPVYFVSLLLLLPGAKMGGVQPVFKLKFGSPELGSFTAVARPEDTALAPGESVVIKVPEAEAAMWERWKAKGAANDPQKVVLVLHQLNFGDGTGFAGQDGRPMPNPNAGYRRRVAPRRRGR